MASSCADRRLKYCTRAELPSDTGAHRLDLEKGFQTLSQSKKKAAAGAKEQPAGRDEQEAVADARGGKRGTDAAQ